MGKIARFCCAAATPIIIAVVLINIAALVSFFQFEVDTDFLNFFAADNPKAVEFNRLQEKYETGETISVLTCSITLRSGRLSFGISLPVLGTPNQRPSRIATTLRSE